MTTRTTPPASPGAPATPAAADDHETVEAVAQELSSSAPELAVKKEKAWREWMMVGVGWTALLSVMALIIGLNALFSTSPHATLDTAKAQVAAGSSAAAVGKPQAVKLLIKADTEHGRLGSDGKWHDAFLPADFTVQAGRRVTVTVYNYDTMPHSFTSSSLSASSLVNQMIPAGSGGGPSKTTFTFTAPSTPGKYAWWCDIPCDPWAMVHVGFMRGYVTVAA